MPQRVSESKAYEALRLAQVHEHQGAMAYAKARAL